MKFVAVSLALFLVTIPSFTFALSHSLHIKSASFGKTADGSEVQAFTGTNVHGVTFKLITYGARLVSLDVPDRHGNLANVTLGLDSVAAYEKHNAHFGGIVGRYANRMAKGKFTLDGVTYHLAINNPPNHLHGGVKGFDSELWIGKPFKTNDSVGVEFTYRSKDGEENYPGNLDVKVIYTLNNHNELKIDYTATTEAPTVINLTNHAYWNLGGVGSGDILGHEVMIAADQYLPTDKTMIPTGELAKVKDTAMDFTKLQTVGSRIAEIKKDPDGPRGYDSCYVLRKGKRLALAARVKDPKSGRAMDVWTSEPGLQFYTSNFLDGDAINGGFPQHAALCLEAEHFPDSPNQPKFPSTVLRPGETYSQTTVHRFYTEGH